MRREALLLDVIVTHQIFISKQNQSRSSGLSPFVQQLISEEKEQLPRGCETSFDGVTQCIRHLHLNHLYCT